jgi:hypothetical protein
MAAGSNASKIFCPSMSSVPPRSDAMRFFTIKTPEPKGAGKTDEALASTFEDGLKDIGRNVMRKYAKGNVFLQLGRVKTKEQFEVEIENLRRPDFDLLKTKSP